MNDNDRGTLKAWIQLIIIISALDILFTVLFSIIKSIVWFRSSHRGRFLPEHGIVSNKLPFLTMLLPGCGRMGPLAVITVILASGCTLFCIACIVTYMLNPAADVGIEGYMFMFVWLIISASITTQWIIHDIICINNWGTYAPTHLDHENWEDEDIAGNIKARSAEKRAQWERGEYSFVIHGRRYTGKRSNPPPTV